MMKVDVDAAGVVVSCPGEGRLRWIVRRYRGICLILSILFYASWIVDSGWMLGGCYLSYNFLVMATFTIIVVP